MRLVHVLTIVSVPFVYIKGAFVLIYYTPYNYSGYYCMFLIPFTRYSGICPIHFDMNDLLSLLSLKVNYKAGYN